jgi:hypothetical protein
MAMAMEGELIFIGLMDITCHRYEKEEVEVCFYELIAVWYVGGPKYK